MTDASLNIQPDSVGKRIFFSPKYRDRRSKVRYNLFDGPIVQGSKNSPSAQREHKNAPPREPN